MNIVLHEPEIPFNTGAIGRTCVATNTALHLIKPYGFFLGDKYLKRAGMDYWQKLSLREYDDYAAFLAQHCIRIPMWGDIRSLNLSNAVAVILYEALRQQDFAALEKQGALHRLHWEIEEEY